MVAGRSHAALYYAVAYVHTHRVAEHEVIVVLVPVPLDFGWVVSLVSGAFVDGELASPLHVPVSPSLG